MSDRGAVAVVIAAAAAALAAPPVPPAASLLFVALWLVTRRAALLAVALVLLVGGRAHDALEALAAPLPIRIEGVAELASDPEDTRFGTRAVLRVAGRRYLAEAPAATSAVLRRKLTGERVRVEGRPRPLRGAPEGWVRSQHLAGRLQLTRVDDAGRGPPWYRVANGVHRLLAAGAAPMREHGPLYLGLVVGDDRGQSDLTRFRFEATGLTHLLAVSGSNVAFVLSVAAPLTSRLDRRARLAVGVALLVLFVLVTRAEPSVLRAAVMAGIAMVAVTQGRVAPGHRVLAGAVAVLLVVDPMLVHSLGFRLSVAATAGLLVLARPIAGVLPGPAWLTAPASVTLAAQVATAPLLLAVNGDLPAVATAANLAAAPAAGAVMVLGITAGPVAGLLGDTSASVVQLPASLLVRWIDGVATVGSMVPLPPLDPPRLALLAAAALLALAGRGLRAPGWLAAPAAVLAVAALWPVSPAVGAHELGGGAVLHVGACGGRVLAVEGAGNHRALLRALWQQGVGRLDVVLVDGARTSATTAGVVRRQVAVGRVLTTAERAPPGIEPIGARGVHVGGLEVTGARIGPSERRCTLAP